MILTVDQIREEIHRFAEGDPDISRIWLFGSYCKGKATSQSDVDVAIEYDDHRSWLPIGEEIRHGKHVFELDLSAYRGSETGATVLKALKECSCLLYDRDSSKDG